MSIDGYEWQVDIYECWSWSNCLNTSYFIWMRDRDACKVYLRFYMYMCDKCRVYDFDSTSDCSDGIGEHVWVYV